MKTIKEMLKNLEKCSKEELIEIIREMKDTLEKMHTNNVEMLEILKKEKNNEKIYW